MMKQAVLVAAVVLVSSAGVARAGEDGGNAGVTAVRGDSQAVPSAGAPAPAKAKQRAGRAWWAPVEDRGWLGIRLASKEQLEQALKAEKMADEWIAVPNTKWLDEEWDGEGALVLQVFPDSPAEKAGLLPGDVILSFNGVRTGSAGELVFVVQRAVKGHDGDIDVLRDGEKRRVLVEVGLHPEDARRIEEEAAAKRNEAAAEAKP